MYHNTSETSSASSKYVIPQAFTLLRQDGPHLPHATVAMVRGMDGKRLRYKDLVGRITDRWLNSIR